MKRLIPVFFLMLCQPTLALPPLAFQYFCLENPYQCQVVPGQLPTVNDLIDINKKINRSISPRAEAVDVWSLNPRYGDCEDYALSKRAALLQQGFASKYLRIAVVKTPSGESHAVLIVKTDSGEYVLDNLTNDILTKNEVRYRWISIQSATNPKVFN